MKNIVGRDAEKQQLQRILASPEAEFVSIYGRRRVGKTFLIREFYKSQMVFDFTGSKDGILQVQLNNFFIEFLKQTKQSKKTPQPTSWHDAFNLLANFLSKLPKKSKAVVFLDEMPWMDTPKSNFIPALEYFWNQHVSRMRHVVLVACGSATSWIRKNLIQARGGLYNRVTQRIALMPFTLHETEQYLISKRIKLPRIQIAELYMAVGGVPFYLKHVMAGKSVTQIIDGLCFRKEAPLRQEYTQLYTALFKDASRHEAIIAFLAKRPQGATRQVLLQQSGIPNATLSRCLQELHDCDFIGAYAPFGKLKKDMIYKLTDNFSLFYIKFMAGQHASKSSVWQAVSKEARYKAWSGYAFENVCMQHVPQILVGLGIQGIYCNAFSWKKSGTAASKGAQVDMLLDRADNAITLCEIKFSSSIFSITKDYAAVMRSRAEIFQAETRTKKAIFNALITPYPATRNAHYLDLIAGEINLDTLFLASEA